jgi:hypothetical protein
VTAAKKRNQQFVDDVLLADDDLRQLVQHALAGVLQAFDRGRGAIRSRCITHACVFV